MSFLETPPPEPAGVDGRLGPSVPVSQLLRSWNAGQPHAAEDLLPQVYGELHRIAAALFRRERADHTLQATALVHEAYLRLFEQGTISWQNRNHFYGVAACVMRRVLVDHSRERRRQKRGGLLRKVPLSEAQGLAGASPPAADILEVDEALTRLAAVDALKASIVELRFFGGLGLEEIAEYLNVAPITVSRHWRRAKAWLYAELGGREARPFDAA